MCYYYFVFMVIKQAIALHPCVQISQVEGYCKTRDKPWVIQLPWVCRVRPVLHPCSTRWRSKTWCGIWRVKSRHRYAFNYACAWLSLKSRSALRWMGCLDDGNDLNCYNFLGWGSELWNSGV